MCRFLFFAYMAIMTDGSAVDAGVYRVSVVGDWTQDKQRPFTASFLIDTGQAPDTYDPWGFRYVVEAMVNGKPQGASMWFMNIWAHDDINFATAGYGLDSINMSYGGCEGPMWSGEPAGPTLLPGRFDCYEWVDWGYKEFWSKHQVVIADIPEPATWGLLLAGFGLMGTALRRRNAEEVRAR